MFPRHLGVSLVFLYSLTALAAGQPCKQLDEATIAKVKSYLADHVTSAEEVELGINVKETDPKTCYTRLIVDAKSLGHPVQLFLSPDQRFLSNSLFDLAHADDGGSASAQLIVKRFLNEPSPHHGSGKHTLVEFGDFQCPFCADFARWYKQLPPDLAEKVTLVFKHFPLPQHSWAEPAAELLACAQKTSPDVFWTLYQRTYEIQRDVNPESLQRKILAGTGSIQRAGISNCYSTHGADDLVRRDGEAASLLHIASTPALFLDGKRVVSLRSEEDFQNLLKHLP